MMKNRKKTTLLILIILAVVCAIWFWNSGSSDDADRSSSAEIKYTFRYDDYLQEHYEKHGQEMGFSSPEEYLRAANGVVANPDALTKTEKEDGDTIYYVENTNEFVVLSRDGYIRTYFCPDDGINYFNRQ